MAAALHVVVQSLWYNETRHEVSTMRSQTLVSTGQGVESKTLARKDEPMTDRVGQQLGNYHLVRLLGRGGQAEDYLGEHR